MNIRFCTDSMMEVNSWLAKALGRDSSTLISALYAAEVFANRIGWDGLAFQGYHAKEYRDGRELKYDKDDQLPTDIVMTITFQRVLEDGKTDYRTIKAKIYRDGKVKVDLT